MFNKKLLYLLQFHIQTRTVTRKCIYSLCIRRKINDISRRAPSPDVKSKDKSDQHCADYTVESQNNFQRRKNELEAENALVWPRIKKNPQYYTIDEFLEKWKGLSAGEYGIKSESVCVRGKLMACRIMGARLIFMDIQQNNKKLQVLTNFSVLNELSDISEKSFQALYHIAQRGDYISATGYAHRTRRGELSLEADTLPAIISPALRTLPKILQDPETRMRIRHVDFLLNNRLQQSIRMRCHIIQYIRNFLLNEKFIEVQTPLIADKASGAIAKPFLTTSTVISDRELALRVAPELWLKRLIIGGFDRVFEIGPAFRNEGFDTIHNPEFTTCELYKAFTGLEELMDMTESLFLGMAKAAQSIQNTSLNDLPEIGTKFNLPFRRIEFIPDIEATLGVKFPDLSIPSAQEELSQLFSRLRIKLPSSPTLPRLLDKLSSLYLEPLCTEPTFIMHHPACMAPLAKSFLDPKCSQIVSARAELFVNRNELANMYEEENSPIDQRRKFEDQSNYRDHENDGSVDESYLAALEWGLPPTGGWGCGVDRLVMLFTGAERINDVLTFGSLRNVVNLGNFVKN